VAYCAAKGGLVLLTKAMALDHARDGIRVNAVCPGDTDTPMIDDDLIQQGRDLAEGRAEYEQAIPIGRMVSPAEVAALVVYLASDAGAAITGAAIPVDGGHTAG
jgi:NAD(P)-dependent dehydrogenase (short-subunit alcohol dehydrogenase family)